MQMPMEHHCSQQQATSSMLPCLSLHVLQVAARMSVEAQYGSASHWMVKCLTRLRSQRCSH